VDNSVGQKRLGRNRFFGCKGGTKERLSASEVLRHIKPRIDLNAEVLAALRMLTRRIGLELIVLQYPALARDRPPSEHGTTHDEMKRGPLFHMLGTTCGKRPTPAGAKVLVRFAGQDSPFLGVLSRTESTLGAADCLPRRGGGREAALQAERPAKAGREALVGSGKGAKAPGGAGFSIRRTPELATEGARVTRVGVSASHHRVPHGATSSLVACAARADLALNRGCSVFVTTER